MPPIGKFGERAVELAALAAQLEEIPAGAVARVLEEPERPLAGALLEARAAASRFP